MTPEERVVLDRVEERLLDDEYCLALYDVDGNELDCSGYSRAPLGKDLRLLKTSVTFLGFAENVVVGKAKVLRGRRTICELGINGLPLAMGVGGSLNLHGLSLTLTNTP